MPQVLKQEIRNRILHSALDCFLENGFRNTSMQEIAGNAGIAAGNIYNYFKNKEALFATLIAPVRKEVKAIFKIRPQDISVMLPAGELRIAEKKMDQFIALYQAHQKIFMLLFTKSDNTKYESIKTDVIDNFSAAVISAKKVLTSIPATPTQEVLIRAYATAFISGIISILSNTMDENRKLEALAKFLPFIRSNLIENLREK